MILNATGGGKSGAILTVTGVAGSTITAAKDGKSFSRTADSSGIAVFKGLESGEWTLTMTSGGETATRAITVTADYSITITFFSATINVTYPAGSTCKAVHTDGTELTAPDTSGTWECVVPSAGIWTVTATDGTNTKAENVEITSEGQSINIQMSYTTYLFNNGDLCEEITGGWSVTGWSGTSLGACTITDTKIQAYGETNADRAIGANNIISFSGYTKLTVTANVLSTYSNWSPFRISVYSKKGSITSNEISRAEAPSTTGSATIELDVTNISDGYILIVVPGQSSCRSDVFSVKLS